MSFTVVKTSLIDLLKSLKLVKDFTTLSKNVFAASPVSLISANMPFNCLTISIAEPALIKPNNVSKFIDPITFDKLSNTGDNIVVTLEKPEPIAAKKLLKSKLYKYVKSVPIFSLIFNINVAKL